MLGVLLIIIIIIIISSSSSSISISVQPLGQFGQEPEPSQATGMALVRCILGKFLGVVCHCFPQRLEVPTSAARCLNYLGSRSICDWCDGCIDKLFSF